MPRIHTTALIFATALCTTVRSDEPTHPDAPSPQTEVLLRTGFSWDGTPYRHYPEGTPEITVLKISVPPHSEVPWHLHPAPMVGYVLAGRLRVEKENGESREVHAGEALPELVGARHHGVTGDEGVELIVFYAGARGLPISVPQPAPVGAASPTASGR